jgi:hypothetical protein
MVNTKRSSAKTWSPTVIRYDTQRIKNYASNNSEIDVCVFVAAGTCLLSRWLVTMGSVLQTYTHTHTHTARWSRYATFSKSNRLKDFRPSETNRSKLLHRDVQITALLLKKRRTVRECKYMKNSVL